MLKVGGGARLKGKHFLLYASCLVYAQLTCASVDGWSDIHIPA